MLAGEMGQHKHKYVCVVGEVCVKGLARSWIRRQLRTSDALVTSKNEGREWSNRRQHSTRLPKTRLLFFVVLEMRSVSGRDPW